MPEPEHPSPAVGTPPTSDEPWRTEVALFRYTLILPLLRHDRRRDGPRWRILLAPGKLFTFNCFLAFSQAGEGDGWQSGGRGRELTLRVF